MVEKNRTWEVAGQSAKDFCDLHSFTLVKTHLGEGGRPKSRNPQCAFGNLTSLCLGYAVARLLIHADQQRETVPLQRGNEGKVAAAGSEATIVKD